MNTQTRILRGTGLTMGTVGVNILGQIITVPIFLAHWDSQTYGMWLIMLSAFSYVFLLSTAFQQYTYSEFLRAGAGQWERVRIIYRTSVATAFAVSLTELAIVMFLSSDFFLNYAFPKFKDTEIIKSISFLLFFYSILNFIIMPLNSITGNANMLNGRYPRVATWALVNNFFCLSTTTIAVAMGADFWTAGLVYLLAYTTSIIGSCIDMVCIARRTGLFHPAPVVLSMGARNFLLSLALAGRTFLESFRQHGYRLLLGLFVGPIAVTTLATTRTLANVLYQGLATITAPILPELMRYVVDGDQDRIEGAFAIVWLSLFAFIIPGLLLLCLVGDQLFVFWTHGAIPFDPILFLMLLFVVVAFAAIQPALAILQGHNQVGWLISASLVAGAGLVLISIALVPFLALRGAGVALFAAELCAIAVLLPGAASVLRSRGLVFPLRSFCIVMSNVIAVGAVTMGTVFIDEYRLLLIVLALAANIFLATLYWFTIPILPRRSICNIVVKIKARLCNAVCADRKHG
jgi:O-antigen/teichoic acid export membrane protein